MKYEEISPVMRAFMGNREGFRKIGFLADDLYLLVAPSRYAGQLACFCVLKTQGKEFSVICGLVEDQATFELEYKNMCEHQHEISQADADRIWQESEVFAKKVDFFVALRAKGIRIPGSTN